ncbi:hypothetical protein [Scleromatobacter humisilvae]|uniref:Uncharacterized protein n=1 Tax=Scleromatobacter humisilvae TaxID=2897159 RepID=A0A9X1YRI4_9BURK|nr:hypothetical protein [Scleromatobacter humisilvae]MCK9687321.1 hypothetical protein [Scleromatobacter humisilvae]
MKQKGTDAQTHTRTDAERAQDEFLARSHKAIEEGIRDGSGITPEELHRRMGERLEAARRQLAARGAQGDASWPASSGNSRCRTPAPPSSGHPMPGPSGHPIVARALELARLQPHSATRDILDAAMEGHHRTHPDFECESCDFNDWLDPPSPFAALLRAAFGAHLDQAEVNAESPRWQADVIDAFATRYGLWV